MTQAVSFNLQSVLEALWRRRTLLLVPILVAVPLSLLAALLVPKVYVARSLMVLQENSGADPFAKESHVGDVNSVMRERLLVLTALVKSDRVLSKVVADVRGEKAPTDPKLLAIEVQDLAKAFTMELIGSEFLEFRLRGNNPSGLAKTLEAINVRFLEALLLDQSLLSAPRILLDRKKADVDAARASLTAVELDIARQSASGTAPSLMQLQAFRVQLIERSEELGRVVARIGELRGRLGASAVPADQLVKEIARLGTARGGPAGASMTAATLDQLQLLHGLEKQRASLEAQVKPLRTTVEASEATMKGRLQREQKRRALTAKLTEASASHEALAARYGASSSGRSLHILKAPERIKLIDPPKDPELPVVTGIRLLIGGVIAGFAMGAGLAMAAEFMDQTLRRPEEFAAITGAPVLLRLPYEGEGPAAEPARDNGAGPGGAWPDGQTGRSPERQVAVNAAGSKPSIAAE